MQAYSKRRHIWRALATRSSIIFPLHHNPKLTFRVLHWIVCNNPSPKGLSCVWKVLQPVRKHYFFK